MLFRPLIALVLAGAPIAQEAANVVVPQVHSVLTDPNASRLSISAVEVEVDVAQTVATTRIDVSLHNRSERVEEAVLLLPVPDGAVVRAFDFEGAAPESTAELLPAGEARGIYDEIVSRSRDPALLEFAGYSTIRSSVFPVPAQGTQKVRIVYEHVLAIDGDRVDYVLPRSESLVSAWTPWTIRAHVRTAKPIATVYSPSHELELSRSSVTEVQALVEGDAAREPGAFQLSFLLQGDGVNASFFAFPDESVGGGYFLLLGGLPVEVDREKLRDVRREIVLVIDTSGSMQGDKFDQAVAAANQVLGGLREGERFNVVDYASEVSMFRRAPVPATRANVADARAYLERLDATGGTALDKALTDALAQEHADGFLPLVLFLTDGLPSVGEKNELDIRANAAAANTHERRVFTFGVGHDVNAPLLDGIASTTGATSTFVAPGEDVEVAVSTVYSRLMGPVLAGGELAVFDIAGAAPHRVSRVQPPRVGDLYEGDQLVVLGRYRGDFPLSFELSGSYYGEARSFRFAFDPATASRTHTFVPRLWASRRIGEIVDEIRQSGADPSVANAKKLRKDPATRELLDEIVALSTEFGILTEYTAFLAREGTDLSKPELARAELDDKLRERLVRQRVAKAAIGQSKNVRAQMYRRAMNRMNRSVNDDLKKVDHARRVRQVADSTFFLRAGTWVETKLLSATKHKKRIEPELGTETYQRVALRLAEEGRQGVFALRGDVLLEVDGEVVLLPGGAHKRAKKKEVGAGS